MQRSRRQESVSPQLETVCCMRWLNPKPTLHYRWNAKSVATDVPLGPQLVACNVMEWNVSIQTGSRPLWNTFRKARAWKIQTQPISQILLSRFTCKDITLFYSLVNIILWMCPRINASTIEFKGSYKTKRCKFPALCKSFCTLDYFILITDYYFSIGL